MQVKDMIRHPAPVAGVLGAAALMLACDTGRPALTQLLEARRLASDLRVEFSRAAEASNRAVMSETDDQSAAAAGEARRARQAVERDAEALQQILQASIYSADKPFLDAFNRRYAEYRRIDDEILPLAVENTNVKAQRLSFGPASDAADAFRSALDRALVTSGAGDRWHAEALAARAVAAVRLIQVLHAPHIAEADLDAMTRMEDQMAAAEGQARAAMQELGRVLPAGREPLTAASAALDRFAAVNKELIAYSRRNSDVRSLALSLGEKRTIAAQCEDQLRSLEDALAKHRFGATR
jgi:hypothetical protein